MFKVMVAVKNQRRLGITPHFYRLTYICYKTFAYSIDDDIKSCVLVSDYSEYIYNCWID